MAEVLAYRRYLYLEYKRAYALDDGSEALWDSKRRSCPGTELPSTFPARSSLMACGYLVLEEVTGADAEELKRAGLSSSQAAAVLAAVG